MANNCACDTYRVLYRIWFDRECPYTSPQVRKLIHAIMKERGLASTHEEIQEFVPDGEQIPVDAFAMLLERSGMCVPYITQSTNSPEIRGYIGAGNCFRQFGTVYYGILHIINNDYSGHYEPVQFLAETTGELVANSIIILR